MQTEQQFVVTYNLNGYHEVVKQHCINNGFAAHVLLSNGTWRKLPNTTLVGRFLKAEDAVRSFTALARTAAPHVLIEKVLACPLAPGYLESNQAA